MAFYSANGQQGGGGSFVPEGKALYVYSDSASLVDETYFDTFGARNVNAANEGHAIFLNAKKTNYTKVKINPATYNNVYFKGVKGDTYTNLGGNGYWAGTQTINFPSNFTDYDVLIITVGNSSSAGNVNVGLL